MFGITPEEQRRGALQLRIEYTIASDQFKSLSHFLPNDKSIAKDGPIFDAASERHCTDGQSYLDLASAKGVYSIMSVPLWTDAEQRGPDGESNVAAILRPISINSRSKRRKLDPIESPSLFD